ncbi:MAG TPA: CAP domain-containing protein [Nitrosopumilaceae archaeon]|nr:CAP domain-containing protein [Nitrosopumilaceae archaeon]
MGTCLICKRDNVETISGVCSNCIGKNRIKDNQNRRTIKIAVIIVICAVGLYNGLGYLANSDILQNTVSNLSNKIPDTKIISDQVSKTTGTIMNASSSISQSVQSTTESLKPKPPSTKEELYQYALQLINEDRKSHGVAPVVLSDTTSAQNHADDMLNAKYFSHWNTNGVKPYVTYTKVGGKGDVAENISYVEAHCLSGNCYFNSFDPFKQINGSEYRMMYDDAKSNWGHRDNIINPNHTHVNLGVSYDNERFYFVEHFENNIVNWDTIQMIGTQLHLVGEMSSDYSLEQINVFSDPTPKILVAQDLDSQLPYNAGYYDQGKLVGMIVPKLGVGYYYPECDKGKITISSSNGQQCIEYTTFENTSSSGIDISVDVSKWMGSGLHTIYVYLKKPNSEQVGATSLTLEYLK